MESNCGESEMEIFAQRHREIRQSRRISFSDLFFPSQHLSSLLYFLKAQLYSQYVSIHSPVDATGRYTVSDQKQSHPQSTESQPAGCPIVHPPPKQSPSPAPQWAEYKIAPKINIYSDSRYSQCRRTTSKSIYHGQQLTDAGFEIPPEPHRPPHRVSLLVR